MRITAFFLPACLLLATSYSNAASLVLTEDDCLEIMQRYASDPESVPQHLLDECKKLFSQLKPAAGTQQAKADPCSDPANADSVQCWGPWAELAPAASGFKPTTLAAIDELDTRPELAEEFTTEFEVTPLPLGSCAAGTACGFATLAPGLKAQPDTTSTSQLVPFAFAIDGSDFSVNPARFIAGAAEVNSLNDLQSGDFTGNMRFQAANAASGSLINAAVNGSENELRGATGIWRHGSLANQTDDNTSAGVFAWGIATTQATLDALNNGNGVSVTFFGAMAGDTRTNATMMVNFGAQPSWSGNWDNSARGFNFTAGGTVDGADLISTPAQFSSNVQQNASYVQGILLGEQGNQSVAHAINITLTGDGGIIKDVGTLRRAP